MLIIAQHNVSNPEEFWKAAKELKIPAALKLHSVFPSQDGKIGTCLWEGSTVQEVQQFLDKESGNFAKNFCYEVNVKEAMGLPVAKMATAFAN